MTAESLRTKGRKVLQHGLSFRSPIVVCRTKTCRTGEIDGGAEGGGAARIGSGFATYIRFKNCIFPEADPLALRNTQQNPPGEPNTIRRGDTKSFRDLVRIGKLLPDSYRMETSFWISARNWEAVSGPKPAWTCRTIPFLSMSICMGIESAP